MSIICRKMENDTSFFFASKSDDVGFVVVCVANNSYLIFICFTVSCVCR